MGEDDIDQWNSKRLNSAKNFDMLIRVWFKYGESTFSRLIDTICRKYNVPCEKILIMDHNKGKLSANNYKFTMNNLNFKRNLKVFLRIIFPLVFVEFLSTIKLRYHQTISFFVWPFKLKHKEGKILIIKERDYVYDFCRDANRYGFRILFMGNGVIYKPWKEKISSDKNNVKIKLKKGLHKNDVMKELEHNEIIKWVSDKCGVNVYPILSSRFQYLLFHLFPSITNSIKTFVKIYEKESIDFALNFSLAKLEDYAAAAAVRLSKSTKSIGFYHGMDAFQARHRYFMEFIHFDI